MRETKAHFKTVRQEVKKEEEAEALKKMQYELDRHRSKLGKVTANNRANLEQEYKLKQEKLEKIITVAKDQHSFYKKLSSGLSEERDELHGNVKTVLNKCINNEMSFLKARMTPNNYTASKNKLSKFFSLLEKNGFTIADDDRNELFFDLKEIFQKVVVKDYEKKEQARIKAQIREEQKLQREIDTELKRIAREKKAIEKALAEALKKAHGEHNAEIELLEQKLQETEEKNQRAISQAQLTKAGYIYVVSNVGSFGEGIYKIGMTRRLQPIDRVKELGDASVPFPFDVHMMISCDNAPALEKNLHRTFDTSRVNKINFRKEFFRVDIQSIIKAVKKHHGDVDYELDSEALQYRQSVEMTDSDLKEIEEVYQEFVKEQ